MENSERIQNQIKTMGKESKQGIQSRLEQKRFDELIQEDKQVFDEVHQSNIQKKEALQIRPRQPEPVIILKNSEPLDDPNKPNSEEEAQSSKHGDTSRGEHNLNMAKKSSRLFAGCNCIKSKCTKNYCQCFTQARKCTEICKCIGCENQGDLEKKYRTSAEPSEGERACNCKKSNCLKKYCQCFNSGVKCTSNCKCQDCKNCSGDQHEEQQDHRSETKKVRSATEIEEINEKIEQIMKMVPREHREHILSFLEYWFS